MELPSFIISSMKLSIPINGVLIRMDAIVGALQRYCHPVTFYNRDSPLELSLGGSSLRFMYRGMRYVLCTKHQVANLGRDPSETIIISRGGGQPKAHSPGQAQWINIEEEYYKNLEDLLLISYTAHNFEPDPAVAFLQLDLSKNLRSVPLNDIRLIFALIYLSTSTTYEPEYAEDDIVGAQVNSKVVQDLLGTVITTSHGC